MREWINRLRDRFSRSSLDAELKEEIAFHRQQLERDAMHAGATPFEARRMAQLKLGNETIHRESARERWGLPWLEETLRAFRHALRGLGRTPGYTATMVLTLGLGIGANGAMFSVVDGLMFRPLAYLRDPGAVHRLYYQWNDGARVVTAQSGPYARYADLAQSASSFAQMAAIAERNLPVGEGVDLRDTRVGIVSASYFAFFDAPPALGRYFIEDEDRVPRGADVAVLSHAYWRTEFGGRDIRGMMLTVGNVRVEVIGVAPAGFAGVNDANPPALWIPITTFAGSQAGEDARTYYNTYRWGFMYSLVRLRDGVSLEQATAEATTLFRQKWPAIMLDNPSLTDAETAQPRVVISSVRLGGGPDPSIEAQTALWTLGIAGLVLLLAIANVTNLAVARTLHRQREQAMRLALGAGNWRLSLYAIVESLVLALLGAVVALIVARWAGAAATALLGGGSTSVVRELVEWRTVWLIVGAAIVVGVIVGVVPMFALRRNDLMWALRSGGLGRITHAARLRASLLTIQGMLGTVLLIGAALFVRSLERVRETPMGYDPSGVVVINRTLRGPFPGVEPMRALIAEMVTAAEAIPEVESAAWASSAPFLSTSDVPIFVEGVDSTRSLGVFTYQITTPSYFPTMRTRIVRGRALTDDDRFGAPDVAVVSESMARLLWPNQDPLGKCVRQRADTMPCITVVGVAEDMVQRDIAGTQRLHYYLSLAQSTRTLGNTLLIRVRGDAMALAERARVQLRGSISGDVFLTAVPLEQVVHNAQRSWRLGAGMFVAFGVLALIVAGVGLHGVVAYDIAQRRHELAVRVALGSPRRGILSLVIGRGVRLIGIGVALGWVLAVLGGRWIEPLLFQQRAVDLVVYVSVGATLLLVALVASGIPAWRASGTDPASALRSS